jgi:hypothetical protein
MSRSLKSRDLNGYKNYNNFWNKCTVQPEREARVLLVTGRTVSPNDTGRKSTPMRIEDIKIGDSLQGIEPAAVVSVLAVVPISANAI